MAPEVLEQWWHVGPMVFVAWPVWPMLAAGLSGIIVGKGRRMDQPFASSAMGDSMNADLLPELSGETWVAATYLDEVTAGLPPAESEPDLIISSRLDETLITACLRDIYKACSLCIICVHIRSLWGDRPYISLCYITLSSLYTFLPS